MQKITPFLWFNDNAEEAIRFYATVFKESEIGAVTRYGSEMPGAERRVMTATIRLFGQEFVALNGGPQFQFTEAVSFVVACADQQEVDYYWAKLSEGGHTSRCGWLKDRFGLSWQIVPVMLPQLLQAADGEKAKRAAQALMQMEKIDIKTLEEA